MEISFISECVQIFHVVFADLSVCNEAVQVLQNFNSYVYVKSYTSNVNCTRKH